MRSIVSSAIIGLTMLLCSAGAASSTWAASAGQVAGWVPVEQPAWAPGQTWFSRTVVVQPTGVVAQSVPVTVVVPATVRETFVEPTFVNTFQTVVAPALTTVVPVETIQSGIQVVQVEPGLNALVAPQFYCAVDAVGNCQALAAQLAAQNPAFTTVTIAGPLGYGVYLAYRV
jgi:hypothetical protein